MGDIGGLIVILAVVAIVLYLIYLVVVYFIVPLLIITLTIGLLIGAIFAFINYFKALKSVMGGKGTALGILLIVAVLIAVAFIFRLPQVYLFRHRLSHGQWDSLFTNF